MIKDELMEYEKYIGDLHKNVWLEIMKGRHQFGDVDTEGR
jgi:hypothetical protein